MINNRELSWLLFNERVLQEAQDKSVPLIQRLRFLGIFSNNQDEFIKVRLANLIRLSHLKGFRSKKLSGDYTVEELLKLINQRIDEAKIIFNKTYTEILGEMESHGIFMKNEKQLTDAQKLFCRNYFSEIISPRIVPLILRKTTKIPFLRDNHVYLGVEMSSESKANAKYAIIQVPVSSTCPRFIELPSDDGKCDIIFSDDIIRLCLDEIFFMFSYDKASAFTFKLMRDSQLTLDDDISKSLMEKMEIGLENRLRGQPVRLIYDKEMSSGLIDIIATKLGLKNEESLDAGGRYHLMRDMMKFPKVRPNLETETFTPLLHPAIKPFSSILKVIKEKDIFLNYPYHSFKQLLDFLREAAIDPKVESIYITLYRTAEHSKIINTLINAAKNGKQVYVVLELLARFDEEQNVGYSELLHHEGVKVINGVNGLKIHSKIILVERKEKSQTTGYAYIGTGNFNEVTAQIYSDLGLFTCDKQIVNDTRKVFDFLIYTHKHFVCKQLIVSPYYMRDKFEKLIENEIKNAKKGKEAYINCKFNSLTDEKMIRLLYQASEAGVKIRLIIRGACCLRPQEKDFSENIQVISIVDRFLEHSRMYMFCNNGDEQMYILSADMMGRNLDRRVEVGVPILDPNIRETLNEIFEIQWSDNVKSREISSLNNNNYIHNNSSTDLRSQEYLYEFYKKMN